MHSILANVVFAFFAQAHAEEIVAKAAPLHYADLENMTLAAIPLGTNLQSHVLPPRPYPTFGHTAWPRAGQMPRFYREKMPEGYMQSDVAARAGVRGSEFGDVTDGGSRIKNPQTSMKRRDLLAGLASVTGPLILPSGEARAVQGYTAGRIPGVAPSDVEGFNQYMRPAGKQGGHGVGWSEIDPYTFLVPSTWAEVPVSIADLGGTEVDLRFKDEKQGDLAVVVAPVLRFADVGFNAKVSIEDLGDPKKMISGFGPELLGGPVDDMVENTEVQKVGGLTYYRYELQPDTGSRVLISMTAAKNRVYIMTVRAKTASQWRKHEKDYRKIQETFGVPGGTVALSASEPQSTSMKYLILGVSALAFFVLATISLNKPRSFPKKVQGVVEPLILEEHGTYVMVEP